MNPRPVLDITDSTASMIAFAQAVLEAALALDAAPRKELRRARREFRAALWRARQELSISRRRN
jgi:hypothetical protein